MKKTIIISSLAFNLLLNAQGLLQPTSGTLSMNALGTYKNLPDIQSSTGKSLKYDEISGSPYLDKTFRKAKIAENYQNVLVRYNSYRDDIEFKNENTDEIMLIPKDDKFKVIEILSPKQKLVLLTLNDEPSGYFYEIVYGTTSLYKKTKVNFIDAKPASTSYGSDQPASFSKPLTSYYIVNGNKSIKNPKNQKDLIQQMPDKKEVLTSFFKENKIKFDKEEDMKKLVIFLNQN